MTFERTDTIEHDIGPNGRLVLGLVDGEIRIRGIDGDVARATVRYEIDAGSEEEADQIHEAIRLAVRRGADRLEIDEPRGGGSWPEALARFIGGGWRRGRKGITVEVDTPRDASIQVQAVSAEIRVEGTNGALDLESVSGDVAVAAEAGTVALETVSGDSRIAAAGSMAIRCQTVSGDIVARAGLITESRMSTVSGSVEVEGAFGPGDHRIETASGDLRVATNGPVTFDVTGIAAEVRSEVEHRLEGAIGHRRLMIGGGGPEVRFRTMSGALLVTRPRTAPQMPPQPAPFVLPGPPQTAPATSDERMAVLRAVESGDMDVDEALRRLQEASHAR
jgi:Putative adhesin